MEIKRNYGTQLVTESYDIIGVTRADMHQMTEVHDRVMDILQNHADKNVEKKEYLSDEDLFNIVGILDVLIEGNRLVNPKSVFEERSTQIKKLHNSIAEAAKPAVDPVVEWDDKAVAEQTSKGQPV